MNELDYCPFCGYDEITPKYRKHKFGIAAYIRCNHCYAQGGTFIGETEDEATESAVRDWNQSDIRPNTICHKVKRLFVQLEYDLRTFWRRY